MKPLPTPIPRTMTLKHKSGWRLELDRDEIYPDDPGNGTPAMVYAPRDESWGTYWCALDNAEVACGDVVVPIPGDVLAWLLNQGYYVEQYMAAGPMGKEDANPATAG